MLITDRILIGTMLVQVIWTLGVMGLAGRARVRALAAGRVGREAALGKGGWPDDVLKIANNMNNQFETPTLFYALGLLALVLKAVGPVIAAAAVVYVASRMVHTLIQTTTNYVPHRFRAFLVGLVALLAMVIDLTLHLTAGTHF